MAPLAPGNRFLPRIVLLSLLAALVVAACQVPDLVGNFGIDASLGGGGAGTGGAPDGGH